jgi:hypothetical protein
MNRKTTILTVAIMAAGVMSGCASQLEEDDSKATAKTRFSVSGQVARDLRAKDAGEMNVTMTELVIDKAPVAGPGNAGFFESDIAADGTFRFEEVPPGRYLARLVPAPKGAVPVTIIVGEGDVSNVEISIPHTTSIPGRIEVEGNGLIPRFNVISGPASVSTTGVAQFTLEATEGDHEVKVAGLPKGYSVASVTYGSTDVLAERLRIAADEKPRDLVVRLKVSSPPPWVRVRGRLTRAGQPASAPRPTRITLTGIDIQDRFEATVRPDGSYEFPRVLPGKYNARLAPEITGLEPARLTVVENEKVDRWDIALPRPEVRVRVVVAGGGDPPNFQLIFYDVPLSSMDPSVTANRAIPIGPDGTFVTILPAGEYPRITPNGLPAGYSVRSFTDGATDILKRPLKIDGKTAKTLTLTLVKKQP